jgi:aspartate/methionine/tyrosine aminotransferase
MKGMFDMTRKATTGKTTKPAAPQGARVHEHFSERGGFALGRWITDHGDNVKFNICSSAMHGMEFGSLKVPKDLPLSGALMGGDTSLQEALEERFGVDRGNIVVTSGATEANLLLCELFLKPNDGMVLERPYYSPLVDVPEYLGAGVVFLERLFENGFAVDVEALGHIISGAGAKQVTLTNLHNPTGVAIDDRTMRHISEVTSAKGVPVMVDEIFFDFVSDRFKHAFELGENILTVGSLSKVPGVGGLRVGWIVGDKAVCDRVRKLKELTTICSSLLDEVITASLLRDSDTYLKKARETSKRNMVIVDRWMASRKDVQWVRPTGGVVAFPRLPEGIDDMEFCKRLVKEKSTLVSPGTYFGRRGHHKGRSREDRRAAGRLVAHFPYRLCLNW